MTLRVGNLANDVKGVELQPAWKVTALRVVDKELFCLLEEQLGRVVDKRLILHQLRHGEGTIDTTAELGMEIIVDRAEKTGQAVAVDDGLLREVKVGLTSGVSGGDGYTICKGTTDVV